MKQLGLVGTSLFLFGCGVIGAPLDNIGYGAWASDVDISSSFSVATIRGESRQLITTYVTCRINHPAKTRKLTFNAGPMQVAVKCTDGYGKSEHAYFNFDAVSGHDYAVRMYVTPWDRSIDLVDVTDNETVIESTSSRR
jgi:hypothetical protein